METTSNRFMIPILYYNGLDAKETQKAYDKVLQQLAHGDFKSADVRKMTNTGYYRARLNSKDRLLFTIAAYNNKKYLLLLEVILNHNYAASRFLRGAQLPPEESMVPLNSPDEASASEIKNLTYINESNPSFHVLNKFISFDDSQREIFNLHPPLIIIGSAGSGKTVLVLEKLKQLKGNIAYISLSNYLVENARKLYFANGYENEESEVDFLSFQAYLQSWRIPEGKEISFRPFEQWFRRHAQGTKITEPHRLYEEFKGVLTGSPLHTAYLSREEYITLGVKQSIFPASQREAVYDLFAKYLQWMKEEGYYDSNLLSFGYLQLVKPRYDYVMVDEVQDITGIQLKCIMQSLHNKGHFILTGDSNQIVHPNFFSWSKIKTYFYHQGTDNKEIRILQTNYRNSPQVVQLSNHLLKIKNARFGSIDRESNYLVSTTSTQQGEVQLMANDDKVKAELNRRTQASTQFAVIVAGNHHKDEARRFFKTPLLFSVQEAKGLEYENVILLNFISNHPEEFREIINGVRHEHIEADTLHYSRPADKSDKDAEIYKFFINSFYVAITRSLKNIYLFEQQVNHPALELLQLKEYKKPLQVAEQKSGREEWLEEARRLEEQGKYEQAEQIRAKYLGYEYISPEQLEVIKALALDPAKTEAEVKKERKQLFQYALAHHRIDWIDALAKLQFQRAMQYMREVRQDAKEYAKSCRLGRKDEVRRLLNKYGPDFAVPDTGQSGLMVALYHGQDAIADMFLQAKASLIIASFEHLLPIDYLLQGYLKTTVHRQQQLAGRQTLLRFWQTVKPATLQVVVEQRRLGIGSHSMPFFLLVCMRSIEKEVAEKVIISRNGPGAPEKKIGYFSMDTIMRYIETMPDEILPPYRKNRQYVNAMLSLHEVDRESPYNKKLFARVKRGSYIINPELVFETE
ncbi:MAG: UvrD-helicase domain-containing protein [Bacteroidota bacterium]|nr:UvrD-helicase domain-containing protein [Bacteroidota bacterium]